MIQAFKMPKTRKKHPLTKLKVRIVGLSEAGMTPTAIESKLGMAWSTICGIVSWFSEQNTVASAPKPGQPCKTNSRDLCQLKTILKENPRMPMPGVRDLLTTLISTTTACWCAHDLGFNNFIAAQKPFLSNNHEAARLCFAEEHQHWDVDNWHKALWTNKSSFEIGKNSKQIYVWQKPRRRTLHLPSRVEERQQWYGDLSLSTQKAQWQLFLPASERLPNFLKIYISQL